MLASNPTSLTTHFVDVVTTALADMQLFFFSKVTEYHNGNVIRAYQISVKVGVSLSAALYPRFVQHNPC